MAASLPVLSNRSLASRFSSLGRPHSLKWAGEKVYLKQILTTGPTAAALQRCSEESIETAVLDAAMSGLSLSPHKQHAYLVPWGGVCTFTPSYRGLEHLVLTAGTVSHIQSDVIRQNDVFDVEVIRNMMSVTHKHGPLNRRGPIIGSYTIAHYANGGVHVEVMDQEALNGCARAAHRLAQQQAKKRGEDPAKVPVPFRWTPKSPFYEEMCKKSSVRRGAKHWPDDANNALAHARAVYDRAEPMDFGEPEPEQPGEPVILVSSEQIDELHALLTDGGIEPDEADHWLTMMAEALGFSSIDQLAASKFADARARLETRLQLVQERRQ